MPRGAQIRYTLDGSTPAAAAALYTRPIWLDASAPAVVVVRARAVAPDGTLGPVASASYFCGVPAALPMLSVIVDPGDLWSQERGIYANPAARGPDWERLAHLTFVDQDRSAGFALSAGVRIHGEWTRAYPKKSFRLYFREEYGASRLAYPLFGEGEVQTFKRLVLHNGGNDSPAPGMNWSLLRNQLIAELVPQTHVVAPRTRPALLYLNGEPWGIYQIRERVDRWFLADHFGVDAPDLLDSPDHALVGAVAAGDRAHWDGVLRFVETHDLADPAHYAHLQAQVDLDNLIDYALIQIYSANADWPEHNVHQFRARESGARWQWVLWDNDYSFGLRLPPEVDLQGPLVELDMIDKILHAWSPETAGRDTLLLRRLLETPGFRDRFLRRMADLLNTDFAPERVHAQIDALAAALAPDIDCEIGRWGGDVGWAASVQALHEFAQQRPEIVRRHAVEAFALPGTATLSVRPPTAGEGRVAVDGALLPSLPWEGVYFAGTEVQVLAVPSPGYRFAGWEGRGIVQAPAVTLTMEMAQALAPRFAPLDERTPRPGDVVFAACHLGEDDPDETWFELVTRRPGLDLRGWRITDNDHKTATDEGSLILADHPALAGLPQGTVLRIVPARSAANDRRFPVDDLNPWDHRIVLYAGNGRLDLATDPGFRLGQADNLALLAPGPTAAFADDQGIAFAGAGVVTPASFGILGDGVTGATCPAAR